MKIFVLVSFLLIYLTIFQGQSFLQIEFIQPNLILIFLIILGIFVKKWFLRFLFSIISLISLSISTGWVLDLIYFEILLIFTFLILDYLPWYPIINIIFSLSLNTIFFNILINLGEYKINFYSIMLELIYNNLIAVVVFGMIYIYLGQNFYEKIRRN